MKKHTEKTPIDDLFARKLSNTSLPVSPGGFERLQARMGQNVPEARVIIWRNPTIQHYMAIAACLVLMCLFGWLYWPSTEMKTPVATNRPTRSNQQKPVEKQVGGELSAPMPTDNEPALAGQNATTEPSTLANESSDLPKAINEPKSVSIDKVSKSDRQDKSELTVTPTEPSENKSNSDVVASNDLTPLNQPATQLAEDKQTVVQPNTAVERVLIVTIAEPEALIAARQVAKTSLDEKPMVAVNDKLEKATKGGVLWQQVKRIKQGDIFARGNKADVESSLLGRAYNGLKHSFDKDKSVKQ